MATNNRPLKAYVRYDGSGRAVSSSLIWRKNKPKVGNWKEVQGYECCNPPSCSIGIVVQLRYSVLECTDISSPTDYRILACNGQLTINTISYEPVPDGYYYDSGAVGTFIVENSVVIGFGAAC
jgi:hypothetical protein